MREDEFLREIRTAEGLPRAVLQKITVEGRNVAFRIATDVRYTPEDEAHANRVAAKYVPEGFTARASVVKSVPDEEAIRRRIADFLREKYPSAAAFVTPEDIRVARDETGGRFSVSVSGEDGARFRTGEILDALNLELGRRFCGAWFGSVKTEEKGEREIEQDPPPPEEVVLAPRFFPIAEYSPIDGAAPKQAIYISDLTSEAQGVCVSGIVSYVQERETAKGKPFFNFTVSDGTGQMRICYFSRKATLEKVRAIKAGDKVCFTGDNELFNGSFSFRAKDIDYGSYPEGFVPEERPSRPVPDRYRAVFPEETSDMRQGVLFGEDPLPTALTERDFVVFDLETTGLNNSGVGGTMDRIIEIGAVKLKGGRIAEKFSSFIACPVKLSKEIVALTGIDDSMLEGAPEIEAVIADFYKFAYGCPLVGHNEQFDNKFIRYYGEKEGYFFENKQYDTLALSQELLTLSNYKLNTVADHFGFTFHHHRAFDDAFVTAQIFIELIKIKKSLPK